ncbi:Soluble N-ethylmaleimide-sensitive factor adaptor protein 30, putative isoform 2 [Theobroma cacao]|uniref:Soluble N-ethylmaleimide-sensitive factor adaptor protein 30, putative isoform 2 n=1 Tax=Theobroma cacao TaxID=3641 RepID=A0A061EHJ8_THECC|nr:Soluble N-ethylmaleimide-sensitive factor adaptor protein 30, putative isoform 2 [Theobroma cacao]
MFGFMRPRQKSVDPPAASGGSTPFDSDTEDNRNTTTPARRAASEPVLLVPDFNDDDHGRRKQTSASTRPSPARDRDRYKNDFRDSGGLQNQTMEDLENYAVYKAEETTSTVNNCLKIAENIREDATRTLDTLHQQGEQIERTHAMAVDIDKDLSKGEKLLNSLGGMFSKPWKPKKTREIAGPVVTSAKSSKKSENQKEQREKLGLAPVPKAKPGSKTPPPEPTNAIQKVELEKAKQDDALSDLSNILGDLKGMAVEMGSELDRQNKALDHLHDDVDELNSRVKGANQRARNLLAK